MNRLKLKRLLAGVLSTAMLCGLMPTAGAYYDSGDTKEPEITDAQTLAEIMAEEGSVLLKNENVSGTPALPFASGEKIAVFGINQLDFVHGGGGSANLATEYTTSLWEGLLEHETAGHIVLDKTLYEIYKKDFDSKDGKYYDKGADIGSYSQGAVLKKGETAITAEQAKASVSRGFKTAIITIGRVAGEGDDRPASDFSLTAAEKSMINNVKAAGFEKIVVILNVPAIVESDWIKSDPTINAGLLVYLPGLRGGNAMGDILCGKDVKGKAAYPSGKLVDTWAKTLNSYPSKRHGSFGNGDFALYKEDIFVGYRYFQTMAKSDVVYPFGYGLSYANFEISNVEFKIEGEGRARKVNVSAKVTNKGTHPGKEVVQVYYGAPEGQLTQPKKELADYYKTKELAAGESEDVTLSFWFDDMASYDELGDTGHEAAYVLEAGTYNFYVGNSVDNEAETGSYQLASLEVVEQLKHRMVPDLDVGNYNMKQRLQSNGTIKTISKQTTAAPRTSEDDYKERYETIKEPGKDGIDDLFITYPELVEVWRDGTKSQDEKEKYLYSFIGRMSDEDLVYMSGCQQKSQESWRTAFAGLSVYGMPKIGTAASSTGIMYNGGVHGSTNKSATYYPSSTMQASTWNDELLEEFGRSIAREAKHYDMELWQAPGMNIHRDPLCGRNFEYFSEDPYVSGMVASAITIGVQAEGFISELKHFACNDQETGRWGNDSRLSERALREIYLKGYELAIRGGRHRLETATSTEKIDNDIIKPWSMMSSYNKINGTYSTANWDLLTEVLRNEWGFNGFVMTDFFASPKQDDEILAGGDLKAPAGDPDFDIVRASMKSGKLQRWQVARSIERIVRVMLKLETSEKIYQNYVKNGKKITSVPHLGLSAQSDKQLILDGTGISLNTSELTWGTFKSWIQNPYNQTYQLLNAEGEAVEDETTVLSSGYQLKVTSEDNVTSTTYKFTASSLSTGKTTRDSFHQSGNAADNTVDGKASTIWSTFVQGATVSSMCGNWMEVDLGDVYHISGIDTTFNAQTSRWYEYEVWAKNSNAAWDSSTAKDKNFASNGYTKIYSGKTPTAASDRIPYDRFTQNDVLARYLVIKITNASNTPAIAELEVNGWKLESPVYTIDDANKQIVIPDAGQPGATDCVTTNVVLGNLKIKGSATLARTGANESTWVYEGDQFKITDDNFKSETIYTVVTKAQSNPDNLALGQTVRASDDRSGAYPAANAVDGNADINTAGAAWLAAMNEWGHWFEVDLGDVYSLTDVNLALYNGASRTYKYQIWIKDSNEAWDADVSKDKDLSAQGYTKVIDKTSATGASDNNVLNGVNARYVVVKFTAAGSGAISPGITEIVVKGTVPEESNIALNKTVRTSYVRNGYEPEKAVDGDGASYWNTYVPSNRNDCFGHWIEVDFGKPYDLSKITLDFRNYASSTYDYEIWTKNSSSAWDSDTSKAKELATAGYTQIAKATSAQGTEHTVHTPQNVIARYLVVKVTGGSSNTPAPSIFEIVVNGTEAGQSVTIPVTGIKVLKDGKEINNGIVKVYTNADHEDHSIRLTTEVTPAGATNKTLDITRMEGAQGIITLNRPGDGTAKITANESATRVGEVNIEVSSVSTPNVKATFRVHVIRKLENPVSISINGVNDPNAAPKYGQTLEADINQLVMTDAGKAALKYQWYRSEQPISGATNKTYTLKEADIGEIISVTVSADESTYYEGTRTAERSQEVVKADGPAIPGQTIYGVKPTDANDDDGKIKGFDDNTAYEYKSEDDDEWIPVEDGEVTGLTPGRYHVRIAETSAYEAGPAITVTILAHDAEGYMINIDPDMENGRVTRSDSQAEEETEITLTIEPARGYRLHELKVIDVNGEEIPVQEDSENIYFFEMPHSDVTVYADFAKLRYTIYHELEHLTCSRGSNDSHEVEFGDTAAITLVPEEGYMLPNGADITIENAHGDKITGWTIDDNGTITITGGVTSDLTITAVGVPQTCTVNFTVTNGVNASDAPRSVGYGEAYTATLHVATGYTLPQNITITMDGKPFADFTYDSVTGVISIGEGILTGRLLVITAVGVGTGPITPVEPDTPDTPDTPDIPVEPSRPDRRPAKPSSSRDDDDDGKDDKTTDNTADVTPPVAPETPAAPSNPQQPASFGDVKGSDWFNSAVSYVSQNGLMSGNNGRFAPDDRLTRGMMAQILYNMEGASGSGSRSFPDVTVNDWFAASVGWAATQGYMGGYSNGAFGSNDPITREQVAAILYRYALAKGLATGSASLDAFVDSASTSDWARDAVSWAVSAGILSGKSGNRLDPTGTASRAEIAQILMNFSQNIAK